MGGLKYDDGGDIVGGRCAACAPSCGVRCVVGSLVVPSRNEHRDGLSSLGARDPKGPIENPLHPGTEYPAPRRHVALNNRAVPSVYRDLPPAMSGRLGEEVHGQGCCVRLGHIRRVDLWKRDAASLQNGTAAICGRSP